MGRFAAILQSVMSAIRSVARTVLKPVWTGTKFVMRPVTEYVRETVLPAAADLAVQGLKATPGVAWAGTKLAARATARTVRISGKLAVSPVVLPVKGAVWAAKATAGAAGSIVGAFLNPLRRGGGGAPGSAAADKARAATNEAQEAAAKSRAAEDTVAKGMPEALLLRKACRALTTGARPEHVTALMGSLQPHTLAWLQTLKQEEVRRVVLCDVRHLARHLAGDASASGLPSFEESRGRETAKAQEAFEKRVVSENAFAARLAAKRDARRGNAPAPEHFVALDARRPAAG